MRSLFSVILAGLAATHPANADSALDLGGGHVLRGNPVSISPSEVVWNHAFSGSELRFPAKAVQRIIFSPIAPPNPSGDILLLNNEDTVPGTLESLDKDKVVMKSPLAGPLVIPRSLLRTARLSNTDNKPAYVDAGDLVGWKASSSTGKPVYWSATNKVIHFSGKGQESIARDVKLPESADISFEVAWSRQPDFGGSGGPSFDFTVCADNDTPGQGTKGYQFNFQRSWASISRLGKSASGNGDPTLRRVQLAEYLDSSNTMHIRVVVDRPNRKLHLLINGRKVTDLQEDSDAPPKGSFIHFHGDSLPALRMRNLRVEPWNGLLGAKIGTVGGNETTPKQNDLVLTVDGDEVFGTIQAIRQDPKDGRVVDLVVPVSQSKPMAVPVHSISHIVFARIADTTPATVAPDAANPADSAKSDKSNKAVVQLDDGSRFTGKILNFDGTSLHFSHLGKSTMVIPVGRLLSLQFPSESPKDEDAAKAASESSTQVFRD